MFTEHPFKCKKKSKKKFNQKKSIFNIQLKIITRKIVFLINSVKRTLTVRAKNESIGIKILLRGSKNGERFKDKRTN